MFRIVCCLCLSGMWGCGSDSPAPTAIVQMQDPDQLRNARELTAIEVSATRQHFDWPFWRGPAADGISRESAWNVDWQQTPPILWKHDVGIGYSAVSLLGNRLLTMGHPRDTEQETIWCLNPETGQTLWSVSYDCALLDHLHKGGPGATPTLTAEAVFTVSREGEVRRLNIETGAEEWLIDLRKELPVDLPEWGFTGSPVLWKDQILLEAGAVIGISQKEGKLLWKTESHKPGYGTPALFEFNEQELLAALNNDGLSIIDLNQQQEIAFYDWESPYDTNATTPIWNGKQFFVSSGYNIGSVLLNFDGVSLSPEWQNKNMRNHMNSCILKQGHLYGFDGNSHIRRTVTLKCLDWENGTVTWSQEGMGCGAVAASRDHLLIMSDEGELILAEIDRLNYREIGRVRVFNEQCWTVPVLCNGRIYCRGAEGTLSCVDVRIP